VTRNAGFLAGAAFVIGALVGTFLIGPAVHRQPRAAAAAATQTAHEPSAFDKAVAEGNAAMDAGRCKDAVAAYERALSVRFDADAATDRGVCLRQLGDRDRALAAFEFVTLKEPEHWQARYNLTALLVESGQVEQARASFAILQKQRPGDEALQPLEKVLAGVR
jgi:Flp pilus assembly protein TadD